MIVSDEAGCNETRHVDRILGRAELRRVGEFHFFQVEDGHAGLNGDGTRREYALYDERSDPGSEESRELWSIVRRVLASTEVASALRDKLDEGFRIRSKRSGESWPVPMHPRPVLYTDLNGYAIKPHPDTRRKVLTNEPSPQTIIPGKRLNHLPSGTSGSVSSQSANSSS